MKPFVTAVFIVLVSALPAQAQTGTVTGRVMDTQTGQPVSSAQIFIEELNLGALTQQNGRYLLVNVPPGTHTVSVERIGYRGVTADVTVGAGATVVQDFELSQEALRLSEVIVTGTAGGTQRRAIGNAVGTVDAANITAQAPINTVQELLTGREPGVSFSRSAGAVGGGAMVRVRGVSSVSMGASPLIYVDGIRVSNEESGPSLVDGRQAVSLDDFNPNDIESIEIIKGPAAATLYGTEASAGVIQIITKKGATGSPQFDLSVRAGTNYVRDPQGRMGEIWGCPATGPQNCASDSDPNNEISVLLYDHETEVTGTPVFRNGVAQTYTLGVRGGTDLVRYFVSGEWDDEQGYSRANWNKRLSARSNVSLVPSEQLSIDVSAGWVDGDTRLGGQRDWDQMTWGTPSTLDTEYRGFFSQPPDILRRHKDLRGFSRFTLSGTVTHHIGPVTQRLVVGRDYPSEENTGLTPRHPQGEAVVGGSLGSISVENSARNVTTVDYSASVNFNYTDDFSFTSSVGAQYYGTKSEIVRASGEEFPSPTVTTLSAVSSINSVSQDIVENKSLGIYLQQEIAFRDRIFLTAAVRGDDNSAFGTNFDAAIYPKFSATWVVSDESFWTFGDVVNSLRLRSAWGKSGRQPDTFAAVTIYKPVVAYGGGPGVAPDVLGNPDLGPEVGTELEVGFDAAFFQDRLSTEFTYYTQKVKDALVSNPVAPSQGFPGSQSVNLGQLSNWGWDLTVDARLLELESVDVDLGVAVGYNMNKIDDLGGRPETGSFREGWPYPVSVAQVMYSAEWVDPVNGIGGATTNEMCDGGTGASGLEPHGPPVPCADAPLVLEGRNIPTWDFKFNPSVTLFDNLRVRATVEMSQGDFIRYDHAISQRHRGFANSYSYYNRIEDNDPQYVAAEVYRRGNSGGFNSSDFFGDFAELREVSLSYNLPQSLVEKMRVSRASISVAGRNLWTIWQQQTHTCGWGYDTDCPDGVPILTPETAGPDATSSGTTFGQVPYSSLLATVRVTF
jgi:TonB-linked SusC/RagA family outer membrane protein